MCLHKSCTICCLCKNRLARHNCETTCYFYSCNTQTDLDPFSFPCKRRLEGTRPETVWSIISSPRRVTVAPRPLSGSCLSGWTISLPAACFILGPWSRRNVYWDAIMFTIDQENRFGICEGLSTRLRPRRLQRKKARIWSPRHLCYQEARWAPAAGIVAVFCKQEEPRAELTKPLPAPALKRFRISNCNT